MPFLSIQSVTKRYGSVKVFEDLSLEVKQGEFVSILGASGCGKTTLLRMIAGFVDPDAGQVLLDGTRIDTMPSHCREAAMVFQNYALFPHLSVFENVAFGLRRRKMPEPELRQRTEEALALVELTGFEGRYPAALSGGQQQRVAVARAVVLNPKLLLLDEPLSNLDARLRKQLRADFLKVHRSAGITSLFVTHDLEEAFSLSDRVALMNRGVIEQFDTPSKLFWSPRTDYVADFIGLSNVISGPIVEKAGEHFVQVGPLSIRVPADSVVKATSRYAIPWHLVRLHQGGEALLDNRFSAIVRKVACLGHLTEVGLELNNLHLSSQLPTTRELSRLQKGDRVTIGWQADDMIPLPDQVAR